MDRVTTRSQRIGIGWLLLLLPMSSRLSFFRIAECRAGDRESAPGVAVLKPAPTTRPGVQGTEAIPQAVIYGAGQEWIYRYAAEELARYVQEMTGRKAEVASDQEPLAAPWRRVVLIGDAAHNGITKRLDQRGLCPLARPRSDGFALQSIDDGQREYLLMFGGDGTGMLSGGNGRGTLYAVYDYLERNCGVGFFEDGERIPKRQAVPFRGIDRRESPRFALRGRNPLAHGGLIKYRARSWGLREWRRNIDWRVRKKMNVIWGWPMATFVAEPRKRSLFHHQWKQVFDYARARGLKIMYSVDYGQVPDDFARRHGDRKYIRSEVYGLRGLHPDDPLAAFYTRQRLEAVIREYGTDHLYFCAPYAELRPEEAPLQVKIRAGRAFTRVLKTIDPHGIWIVDTWDFLSNGALWTKENVKAYLAEAPRDFLIVETGADSLDLRHEHDFFHGKDWIFGVLHALGGDDEMHGDPADLIRRVQEVAADPDAKGCKGLVMAPEIAGCNIFYYDLAAKLAWKPGNLSLGKFLEAYVRRRYGEVSAPNMLASMTKLVAAMYTGNGFFSEKGIATVHQNQAYHQCLRLAPLFEGREEEARRRLAYHERQLPLLKEAVALARREEGRQRGNRLYESYMVELVDTYLGKLSNGNLLRLFLAFKQGDEAAFEASARDTLAVLGGIETLLSTRDDYSLKATIDEILRRPGEGSRPTPRDVRLASIAWNGGDRSDYLAVEGYEQIPFYYRPRVQLYIAELRRKLRQKDRSGPRLSENGLAYMELDGAFDIIRELWLKNALGIESQFRFSGTPLAAIETVLAGTEDAALRFKGPASQPAP